MSAHPFPTNVEQLSSDWLTAALRANGFLKESAVCRFSVDPISTPGATAAPYRITLEYEGQSIQSAPKTLMAKFPSISSATRSFAGQIGMYSKEVSFYKLFGREHALPIPATYVAEFDSTTGRFVLLMEDLSAARMGSVFDDSVEDIRVGLLHLVQIHSEFWDDPMLDEHDWISRPDDADKLSQAKNAWSALLPKAQAELGGLFSDYTWSVCEKWLVHWDDVVTCINGGTHTLLHSDAYLGQMFFPTPELPRFVLFDWQSPSKGWAASDVVRLLATGLSPENRRENEHSLIDLYYHALCQQGIHQLTKERFWFQVKLSHLWNLFINTHVSLQQDMQAILAKEATASGRNWQEVNLGYISAATDDWLLADVIDQAVQESRSVARSFHPL